MRRLKKFITALLTVLLLLLCAGGVCAEETEASGNVNISATTEVRNTPAFTVTIPQSIPMGTLQRAATQGSYADAPFQVSLSGAETLGEKTVLVKVSTADGQFKLYNGSYALPFEVKIGDAVLKSGDTFASFTAELHDAVSGKIVIDRYNIATEGVYAGVLIFTVSVTESADSN